MFVYSLVSYGTPIHLFVETINNGGVMCIVGDLKDWTLRPSHFNYFCEFSVRVSSTLLSTYGLPVAQQYRPEISEIGTTVCTT